jgi:hypothetical protein
MTDFWLGVVAGACGAVIALFIWAWWLDAHDA